MNVVKEEVQVLIEKMEKLSQEEVDEVYQLLPVDAFCGVSLRV